MYKFIHIKFVKVMERTILCIHLSTKRRRQKKVLDTSFCILYISFFSTFLTFCIFKNYACVKTFYTELNAEIFTKHGSAF